MTPSTLSDLAFEILLEEGSNIFPTLTASLIFNRTRHVISTSRLASTCADVKQHGKNNPTTQNFCPA